VYNTGSSVHTSGHMGRMLLSLEMEAY